MKHDQAKIDEIMGCTYDSFAHDCPTTESQIEVAMKAYAEHMDRWRVVADGELPDEGQMIVGIFLSDSGEIVDEAIVNSTSSRIHDFTHWKPIELPETE